MTLPSINIFYTVSPLRLAAGRGQVVQVGGDVYRRGGAGGVRVGGGGGRGAAGHLLHGRHQGIPPAADRQQARDRDPARDRAQQSLRGSPDRGSNTALPEEEE